MLLAVADEVWYNNGKIATQREVSIMGLLQPWHLIIILVIVLIIFGPGKLPDIGKAMGKTIREFKQASSPTLDELQDKAGPGQEQIAQASEQNEASNKPN